MRRVFSVLAILLVTVTTTAAAATARTSATKCTSGGHSGMDMSGKVMCTKGSMGKNNPVVAGAREIAVSAKDLAFSPNAINLSAGENATIVLSAGDVAHDFYVKGVGHIVHAKARKTAQGGLRIDKAGTYKFWCTVSGHKQAGMTGTITVT